MHTQKNSAFTGYALLAIIIRMSRGWFAKSESHKALQRKEIMKFIVQRVSEAKVSINGTVTGQIRTGFVVLIGISNTDNIEIANKLVNKLINLRIFQDENGKTNLSLSQVNGELLLISQFTLYANCKKGNRPSFIDAGEPGEAESLYRYIVEKCRQSGTKVETGEFGAIMNVSLVNSGPFTIILDSNEL